MRYIPTISYLNVHFIEAKDKQTRFGICTYQAIRSFREQGDLIPTQIPIQLAAKWKSPQLSKELT
jgi:hypothetical protein